MTIAMSSAAQPDSNDVLSQNAWHAHSDITGFRMDVMSSAERPDASDVLSEHSLRC